MRKSIGTLIGKSVATAVKVRGKSSGQAMPGLVVESLVPRYLQSMLRQLPEGVVVITGTNGKTTTTKMAVELLRANGKRVLTNATGSNLTRGIISSVTQQATLSGKLPYDIAVLELDEAYASRFTREITPEYVVALNASRDQLDRFGEVDRVATLVGETMLSASKYMIVNADDTRLSAMAVDSGRPALYFGVAPELLKYFPRDEELVSVGREESAARATDISLAVELRSFENTKAVYRIAGKDYAATLAVTGQHNFQNAAAALALVCQLLPDIEIMQLLQQLETIQPAFGRGQTYILKDGSSMQLNLVKNPASFRQAIASYIQTDSQIMIAVNDGIADSKDTSWLWDVDFASLQHVRLTTGTRAADMALRLRYDDVHVETIEPNIEHALKDFMQRDGDKVIFATYTAMLRLHKMLQQSTGKKV